MKADLAKQKKTLVTYQTDFSHYDEVYKYLHPEYPSFDKIDYWTGYYSNRPTFKNLICKGFQVVFNTMTFTNLAQAIIDADIRQDYFDACTVRN